MHQFHSSKLTNSHINFDMLFRELNALSELAGSTSIVVEGKRDALTLRGLGIDAKFFFISGSGDSVHNTAEKLVRAGKEVIVLTDFDKKGKQLSAKLISELNSCDKKIKINTEVRRNLMAAFSNSKIGEIEDLKKFQRVDINPLAGIFHQGAKNGKNRYCGNKICHKGKNNCNWRS